MPTHLFNAYIKATDGSILAGPVTVEKGEYLFVNKNNSLNVSFNFKKTNDGWRFAGELATNIPIEYIKSVGDQVDIYYKRSI
ncbi:hypothetical protein [Mucilaginibacter sp. UYCu711]|uniref:hypothetical protein n=1 Tax=Mucilaginibacter sp. UYCu711 TaxID=3156339 RepID=UPI003D243E9A